MTVDRTSRDGLTSMTEGRDGLTVGAGDMRGKSSELSWVVVLEEPSPGSRSTNFKTRAETPSTTSDPSRVPYLHTHDRVRLQALLRCYWIDT